MDLFIEGFILQASLILVLGSQNIFVLESGLRKQHHLIVAAVCTLCDALLIAIGVLGAASIFVQLPLLKISFGLLGVLFLAFYGLKKLHEGIYPTPIDVSTSRASYPVKKALLLTLGFSVLNPHVLLDTIVLIGGYATQHKEMNHRLLFGSGAVSFSTIWFFGLAFFAQMMSSILNNAKSMRIIAFTSGTVLLLLSLRLAVDVYGWLG